MHLLLFRENSCVRVFGSLREYEGRKHILLFSISTLQDWNEQTNHLLEVVYTHLQITRGPIPVSLFSYIIAVYIRN